MFNCTGRPAAHRSWLVRATEGGTRDVPEPEL